jgi:hypothetical protein
MEQLRKKYEVDADLMGTKSRFGFFSIPPSHAAARTVYSSTRCHKDSEGKVTTADPNILTVPPSSGVLKKSYFSIPKSIYHGDPYDKPTHLKSKDEGKSDIIKNGSNDQEVFKPAMLNKTL